MMKVSIVGYILFIFNFEYYENKILSQVNKEQS